MGFRVWGLGFRVRYRAISKKAEPAGKDGKEAVADSDSDDSDDSDSDSDDSVSSSSDEDDAQVAFAHT